MGRFRSTSVRIVEGEGGATDALSSLAVDYTSSTVLGASEDDAVESSDYSEAEYSDELVD